MRSWSASETGCPNSFSSVSLALLCQRVACCATSLHTCHLGQHTVTRVKPLPRAPPSTPVERPVGRRAAPCFTQTHADSWRCAWRTARHRSVRRIAPSTPSPARLPPATHCAPPQGPSRKRRTLRARPDRSRASSRARRLAMGASLPTILSPHPILSAGPPTASRSPPEPQTLMMVER